MQDDHPLRDGRLLVDGVTAIGNRERRQFLAPVRGEILRA